MGSQKHDGSSETSSDDQETSTHNSDGYNNNKEGLGRTYECNFCKRGFTNAQALGGHMNIHRKDKAKAKKLHDDNNIAASSAKSTNKDHRSTFNPYQYHVGSNSFGLFHTAAAASNPNFHWSTTTLAAASQNIDINNNNHAVAIQEEEEELKRVNLNLRIGTSSEEIGDTNIGLFGQQDWYHDQNDIDLELRLGHYP